MTEFLKNLGDYALPAFIIMLALIGIYTQVRSFLNKDKRDEKSSKYHEFLTTIDLLQKKLDLQEEAIFDLSEKVKTLEMKNAHLLDEINVYNDRANHYLYLFATRCPLEQLQLGKGYCDFFHPIDRERIRENIMSMVQEERGVPMTKKEFADIEKLGAE